MDSRPDVLTFSGAMKTTLSVLCASALAIASLLAVPTALAASSKEPKAAKKTAKELELEKYDANRNGKLDRDERATMKADEEKAEAAKTKSTKKETKAKKAKSTP